ncbi:TonB-dependent receptor [Marinilabilia sp.]
MNTPRFSILIFLFFAMAANLLAQGQGSISGRVLDTEQFPLPGANVYIESIEKGAVSDREGKYRIANVPAGDYELTVSFIGFDTQVMSITVGEGETTTQDFTLEGGIMLEGITVGSALHGQAKALNQQKTAPNIKNVVSADLIGRFPDPNVAEALQRIPGISVQRDQGEGRYVQIRGTDPNLSNVTINGEQIAAPEGDDRTVALDMIPSDILSSIEVTKAITPDMDGDAIGGSVNLNTMGAVSGNRVLSMTASAGYNNLVEDLSPVSGRGSLAFGNRTGDRNQFGYMISGSYNRSNRASNNNEMEYDEGELDELQLRDYELTRERLGLVSGVDYRFSDNSVIFLRGNYNYFSDQEYRRRFTIAADELARDFKDRLEEQQVFSLSAGGEHLLSRKTSIDYMLSYSYSDQNTPSDREISYVMEDEMGDFINFDRANPDYPKFSSMGGDPYNYSLYEFDEFGDASEITTDQHFTSRLNLKTNFELSGNTHGYLKYGGLARFKSKDRDITENIYDYGGDVTFPEILGNFEDPDFLDNKYEQGVGRFPTRSTVSDLFDNNRSDFENEEEDSMEASNAEDYDATENTYAGYLMTDLKAGNFSTLFGVRYEHTKVEYTANITEFDMEGDLITPIPSTNSENTFDFFLPMVHLTYDMGQNGKLRLAWTNTFAKPRYFDLAPYRIIAHEDEELELGNPDLEAARSMNFDLMSEYYFSNVGIISGGLFYKQIKDFIYISNFEYAQAGPYQGYETTQPVNGEEADLFGFEVNLQRQLDFLPGFASGFGIYANYTYTWSEADLTTEGGTQRTVSLPGQAENVANFALSYEKGGFSSRISLNYAGAFVDEIRETSDSDRYYDERFQLDVSASQKLTSNIRIFAEVMNLTNAPLRYYNGVSSRPEQQEFYSWWGNFGVKLNL